MTKGTSAQPSAVTRTQGWGQALTGLGRVREAAARDKDLRLTSLMHHVTTDLLRKAFFALKKNAAAGVDQVTWHDYRDKDLLASLERLHERVQNGRYRAMPSRRTWIPKENGERRGLGIAALEDKIVQQALVWVLEAIYEPAFLGFSYGFRPGRSQHKALDALAVGISRLRVNWVIDADVRRFFDTVDHDWLVRLLRHRIGDERVLRLIQKWLKAGVMEGGQVTRSEVGTPQGAVISPILANIMLHYVFDLWVHGWRQQKSRGNVIVVRYADDFVIGCENRDDAQRLHAALFKRFAQFGLQLHPEKTRLIAFGRLARYHAHRDGLRKPETFGFLGFTHACGIAKSNGGFKLLRLSRKDRLRAKLRQVKEWLRRHMHSPIPFQGRYLRRVVQGWLNYHAVPGNDRAINGFRYQIVVMWRRVLRRRSQKAKRHNWDRMNPIIDRWLPVPRIRHPWPSQRFMSNRGRSRMR